MLDQNSNVIEWVTSKIQLNSEIFVCKTRLKQVTQILVKYQKYL